jgi:protease PrsW
MSNQWTPPPGWYAAQPPPSPPPPPGASSDGKKGLGCQIAAIGCFGLAMFLFVPLLLLLFLSELGPVYLMIALFMAFVPAVVYTLVVLAIDRLDPEPVWALALAFLWGGVIAVVGSLVLNDTSSFIAGSLGGAAAAEFAGAVIAAPFAEEAWKGLGLLVVLLLLRKEFDGVVDGIVYACMIALGFATVENVLYYGRALSGGGAGAGVTVWVLRGVMSPFAHPLFTSMTGIGFGLAREQKRGPLVWIAPILGYLVAVILHMTWNGVPTIAGLLLGEAGGLLFFLFYIIAWVPAFLCFLLAIGFCLRREWKIIRDHLQDEVALGIISQEEFAVALSPFKRFTFTLGALQRGGPSGYRAARQFSRTATRLALSKWHTVNADRKQAETRSLGMVPLLRQQLAEYRAGIPQ